MPGPRPEKTGWGGWSTFTSYASGLAACGTSTLLISGPGVFQLQSGPGRLDYVSIQPSQSFGGQHNITSGGGIIFLDLCAATSGAPFVLSGDKVVATTPTPAAFVTNSGFGQLGAVQNPILYAQPFNSGLYVKLQSGQPGFTAGWSPEPGPVLQVRPRKDTWGGWLIFTSYASGLGACGTSLLSVSGPGDFMIQGSGLNGAVVGAGRLDEYFVQPSTALGGNPNINSGTGVVFYDAAVATSGGPFPASGHKIIAVTPNPAAYLTQFGSGFTGVQPTNPQQVSMPFQSGLCVHLQSGQPGFTIGFSPEPPSTF